MLENIKMPLQVEKHDLDGEEKIVLSTDDGKILAIFISLEAAEIYKAHIARTWIFAHECGRSGI